MSNKNTEEDRVLDFLFSDAFRPNWETWKEYKRLEWKFKYKSVLSEQAAINLLSRLSGKNETIAADIIRQSMENGWQGLFSLKNNFNGSYQQQPNRSNPKTAGAIKLLGMLKDDLRARGSQDITGKI